MRVLYVSKALHVAAYRGKLRNLAEHVEVRAVIPHRWGNRPPEPGEDERVELRPAILHGHNHLHLYRRPGLPLDSFRPDLVHIDEEPYSAVTAQYVRACVRRAVPCLFFAWQNIDKTLPAPFPALRRYVFRNVRGGIAGTDEAASVLRAAGYDGPIAVIPQFGVDPERFGPDPVSAGALRTQIGARPDDVIVGYGGRLIEEKGLALLIEAVAPLERVRLVMIGAGPMRSLLERRARAADLHGRVHFLGDVTSREMPQQLAGLDILALPSLTTPTWKEQFGRVLVEAMACGVPVVGSDSGEIPQVIGDAGLIVAEGDAAALTQALRQLAETPATRAELGLRARKRVLERYTNDRIAEDTVMFYRDLLGARVAS